MFYDSTEHSFSYRPNVFPVCCSTQPPHNCESTIASIFGINLDRSDIDPYTMADVPLIVMCFFYAAYLYAAIHRAVVMMTLKISLAFDVTR